MVKVFFGSVNGADVMDYDSLSCTFLCSASLGEYLTQLLENHVEKFVHSHAEKGFG